MVLTIGPYKVKISAEDLRIPEQSREMTTSYALNNLSIMLHEASEAEKANFRGRNPELAEYYSEVYKKWSDDIYYELKKRGFYEEVKNEND